MTIAKDEKINLIRLYFLVVGVGLFFFITYFILCLIFFYGKEKENILAEIIIYGIFLLGHLILNLFVIAAPRRFTPKHRIISTALILMIYIFVAIKFTLIP